VESLVYYSTNVTARTLRAAACLRHPTNAWTLRTSRRAWAGCEQLLFKLTIASAALATTDFFKAYHSHYLFS